MTREYQNYFYLTHMSIGICTNSRGKHSDIDSRRMDKERMTPGDGHQVHHVATRKFCNKCHSAITGQLAGYHRFFWKMVDRHYNCNKYCYCTLRWWFVC